MAKTALSDAILDKYIEVLEATARGGVTSLPIEDSLRLLKEIAASEMDKKLKEVLKGMYRKDDTSTNTKTD